MSSSVGLRASLAILALGLVGSSCGGSGNSQTTADGSVVTTNDGGQVVDAAPVIVGPMMMVTAKGTTITAGTEKETCEIIDLTNDAPMKVNHLKLSIDSNGSHHAIVQLVQPGSFFANTSTFPNGAQFFIGGCSAPGTADNPILIGSQRPVVEYQFPSDVFYPIGAHQRLLFNYHYINATAADMHTNVKLEIGYGDDTRTQQAGSLFYNWTHFQAIGVGETSVQSKTCNAFTKAVSVLTLNGHQHQLGTQFDAFLLRAGAESQVYTSSNWHNPEYKVYSPTLQIQPGDQLKFTCTWNNTTGAPVSFGVKTTNEMCILGGYVFPSDALTVTCGSD